MSKQKTKGKLVEHNGGWKDNNTNDYTKDKKKEKTSNAFETNTNKILDLKTEYVCHWQSC